MNNTKAVLDHLNRSTGPGWLIPLSVRPSPAKLVDILEISDATARRKALRKATLLLFRQVTSVINQQRGLTLQDIANLHAFRDSSVRASISSIRDYTSEECTLMMAAGLMHADDYLKAIEEPSAYGLRDDAYASGWRVGVNHNRIEHSLQPWDNYNHSQDWEINLHNFIRALASETATPETTTMSHDFTEIELSSVVQACSYMVSEKDHTTTSLSDTLSAVGVPSRICHAIEGLVKASGSEKFSAVEHDSLSAEAKQLVDAMSKQVAGSVTEGEAAAAEATAEPAKPVLSEPMKVAINTMLGSAGMDDIDTIVRNREKTEAALANLTNEFSEMKRKMATMHVSKGGSVAKVSASGELPSGGATWRNANEVLKEKGIRVPDSRKHMFQFEVPFFEWDSEHRDVPQQDEAYRWRWDVLAKLMWGLAFDKKPWVWGHTGTGKTTLVEQVCSILNWPFVRVNFDSEITRMDLIGKDGLTTDEHGNTISYFKDGILPQAMSQPTVICNDELDFVRPDIAYVYQRALEGNGLLLTEDAGRLIRPHEYNRMVATANTQGQGDEFGLYQGARVQSQAFLDRFQCWVEVGYLNATDEKKLVQARVPSLAEDMVDRLIKYVREHREAFKQAAILKPLSPRGVISTAEAIAFFTSLHPKAKEGEAVRMAIEATVLGSVTHADAAKINELVDRTFN